MASLLDYLRQCRVESSRLFPAFLKLHRPLAGICFSLVTIALLVPALAVMHASRGTLSSTLPLLFLLPVLVASAVGDQRSGAAVAVAAIAVWDWFFVPPLHTITIQYSKDVLALSIFLLVALLTGKLASDARQQAAKALQRAAGAEALYELSQALIGPHETGEVLAALTERLYTTFPLAACAVLLPSDAGWRTVAVSGVIRQALTVEQNRTLLSMTRWVSKQNQGCGLPEQHLRLLPLQVAGRNVGVLQLIVKPGTHITAEQERLIQTFANGTAIALEQARLAEEEQLAALARERDRLKTALLSSVSHDLRTPLAGIKAAATSLLQCDVVWSEEDRNAFAADIDREADRLARLVSNMLDLSRLELGVIQPDRDWEDVLEVVQSVVDRMKSSLSGHPVIVHAPERLPPAYLDVVHLSQILTNLLENAAKYSPEGAPIVIAADRVFRGGEPAIHIVVRDRGPGVAAAERDRIFEPFYRASQAAERAHGTGLGLAIVRGLAAAHGGSAWVESRADGSDFHVALPLGTPAVPHPELMVTP